MFIVNTILKGLIVEMYVNVIYCQVVCTAQFVWLLLKSGSYKNCLLSLFHVKNTMMAREIRYEGRDDGA